MKSFFITQLNAPMPTMSHFIGNNLSLKIFIPHANTVFDLKDSCIKNVGSR